MLETMKLHGAEGMTSGRICAVVYLLEQRLGTVVQKRRGATEHSVVYLTEAWN